MPHLGHVTIPGVALNVHPQENLKRSKEMIIGKKIRELREKNGVSTLTLAKEIGVSQRAIEYWEREKRVPRIESIKAIADYFNISLDSFF